MSANQLLNCIFSGSNQAGLFALYGQQGKLRAAPDASSESLLHHPKTSTIRIKVGGL
jgi:hypothetical protein